MAGRILGIGAIFAGGGYAFTDDVGRAVGFTLYGVIMLARPLLAEFRRARDAQ